MPTRVQQIDDVAKELDSFEKTRRKFLLFDYVAFPLTFGFTTTLAVVSVINVDWLLALINIAGSVFNWYSGKRAIENQKRWAEAITEARRKVQWYRLLAAGEDYRVAHSEEGKAKQMPQMLFMNGLCEKHGRLFNEKNGPAAAQMIIAAYMQKVTEGLTPGDKTAFDARVKEQAATGQAMCCFLSEEVLAQILRNAPASTGDTETDIEVATGNVPERKNQN